MACRPRIRVPCWPCCCWPLAACTTPQTAALDRGARRPAIQRRRSRTCRSFPQEDYYCGPAALATVLAWGRPAGHARTSWPIRSIRPGRQGTLRSDILTAARRQGRLAVPIGVAAGTSWPRSPPAIRFWCSRTCRSPGIPSGTMRWRSVTTWERREITLTVRPRSGAGHLISTLSSAPGRAATNGPWRCLPPNRLPVSADEQGGPAGRSRARAGRARARGRGGLFGDSRALAGQFRRPHGPRQRVVRRRRHGGAELAYRQAIDADPERAEAWNNLAYVLAARGLKQDAVAAAREALRLSPDNQAPYLDTLKDVSGS